MFNPAEYIKGIVEHIRGLGVSDCALAAVSGGVDSVTSAVVARLALGDRLRAVVMDTGFLRENEARDVVESLSGILNLELVDVSSRFYSRMLGLSDAEEKRLTFRGVFYETLSDIARSRGCGWLVQGTIAPDWIETMGGIKTQHNVLEQVGVDTARVYGFRLIEPLRELYKDQVRAIARHLGIPGSVVNRQPFPGPGLSIRAVGRLTLEKLGLVRWATRIVEDALGSLGLSQWFAAAWEDETIQAPELGNLVKGLGRLDIELFRVRGTGVKGDSRAYGPIALVRGDLDGWDGVYELYHPLTSDGEVTHVVYELARRGRGRYFVAIRAVLTDDFMTADVPRLSKDTLVEISRRLLENDLVSAVGFDVTPKPPATIEFE